MADKVNLSNIQPRKKQKVLMREKRNKQYNDMAEEWSNLNISEIRVEDFAEARKKELNKFVHILNNKYNSKTGFQLLPKHMRRRQMSHNPFRIPVRSRIANLNVNVKSKCRKHKKRRAFLKTSIIRRARKNNWLETHIWNSKRFIMKKLFGYTIAQKRRDKGFRACYSYSKYDSCIYDASYFNYLIMRTEGISIQIFNDIINTFSIDQFSHPQLFKSYSVNLYNPESGRLIGPVKIILFDSRILIKFHPLMKNEILTTFKNSQYCDRVLFSNTINNFSLIGPHSASILFKIVKSLAFKDDISMNQLLLSVENEVNFEKDLHYLKEGQVIVFKQMKPKSNFRMNEFTFNKITNEILKESNNDKNVDVTMKSPILECIRACNEINCNKALDLLKIRSKLLSEYEIKEKEEREMDIEIPTERTVFQHRKNVNLDKLNKKISLSIKQGNRKQSPPFQSKKFKTKKTEEKTENLKTIEPAKEYISNEEETFFIIVKENICKKENNQIVVYPIFSLIFPNGYSSDLLRRFVYLESRPIGLSEYNYYLTDSSQLVFPNDYPSTESYRQFICEKTIEKIDKYCRYPPSKRVNYQKIRNPFPFYPSWNKIKLNKDPENEIKFTDFNKDVEVVNDLMNRNKILSQFKIQKISDHSSKTFLIPISLEMTSKGIPFNNSLICLPSNEDMKNYKEKDDNKFVKKNFISTVLNNKELMHKIMRSKEISKEKIIEPKLKTEIKNKIFNTEYKTIRDLKEELSYSSDILNMDFTIKLQGEEVSRKVIGFVTSGEFSYNNSKGVAKGFIILESYQSLVKLKDEYKMKDLTVLIRNKDSRLYHSAKINTMFI